jgi:putative oxidoreductase
MTSTVVASGTQHAHPSRALHISLWVAQALLALAFAAAGTMKLVTPVEETTQQLGLSGALIRFIGVSEVLGAIGVIVPAATRIKPWLTPLAAAALTVVMVLAAMFHISRGELSSTPANFVLGALGVFVAWGRWRKAPIAPR